MAIKFEKQVDGQPPANWAGDLTEREQHEISFSRLYADHFGHGTDGHNAKMIIAKLATKLDLLEASMPYHQEQCRKAQQEVTELRAHIQAEAERRQMIRDGEID